MLRNLAFLQSLVPEAVLVFENPKLDAPVRQRQAQAGQIGIAGEDLRLDGCDLPVASVYS